MTEELLPCPFCGGEAEFFTAKNVHYAHRVRCTVCEIQTGAGSAFKNDSFNAWRWNTRTDKHQAALDALKVAGDAAISGREKIAKWMIEQGFSTGRGDTIDDLLNELGEQIEIIRGGNDR